MQISTSVVSCSDVVNIFFYSFYLYEYCSVLSHDRRAEVLMIYICVCVGQEIGAKRWRRFHEKRPCAKLQHGWMDTHTHTHTHTHANRGLCKDFSAGLTSRICRSACNHVHRNDTLSS